MIPIRFQKESLGDLEQADTLSELKIPAGYLLDNRLLDQLRYMVSADYPIEKIPHLVFDRELSTIETIVNPMYN